MKNRLIIIFLLAAVAILGFFSGQLMERDKKDLSVSNVSKAVDYEKESLIAQAVHKVSSSVVSIETVYKTPMRKDPFEEFFREYFGEDIDEKRERVSHGAGSGVLYSQDGVILTAGHVVDDAKEVYVTLPGGKREPAVIMGVDQANDIAVLKIEGTGLPCIRKGDSSSLIPGEWMIALGNPFGLMAADTQPTVTVGVVSAVMRSITMNESPQIRVYHGLIQTDAAINPGNSGGPLVDAQGLLMGINTAIFSTSGGSQGIGFAIPVNTADKSAKSILKYGRVKRGWTGIVTADVDNDIKEKHNIPLSGGVMVTSVHRGSAAEGKVRPGQIIVEVNGVTIKNQRWWNGYMSALMQGEEILLKVWEKGVFSEISMRAAILDSGKVLSAMGVRNVEELTYEQAKKYNLKREKGMLVTAMTADNKNGQVMLHDVIRGINRRRVYSRNDLESALESITAGSTVMLLLERKGYFINHEVRL